MDERSQNKRGKHCENVSDFFASFFRDRLRSKDFFSPKFVPLGRKWK